jgi:hypothetical protein
VFFQTWVTGFTRLAGLTELDKILVVPGAGGFCHRGQVSALSYVSVNKRGGALNAV